MGHFLSVHFLLLFIGHFLSVYYFFDFSFRIMPVNICHTDLEPGQSFLVPAASCTRCQTPAAEISNLAHDQSSSLPQFEKTGPQSLSVHEIYVLAAFYAHTDLRAASQYKASLTVLPYHAGMVQVSFFIYNRAADFDTKTLKLELKRKQKNTTRTPEVTNGPLMNTTTYENECTQFYRTTSLRGTTLKSVHTKCPRMQPQTESRNLKRSPPYNL